MTELVLIDSDAFAEIERVAELHVQGKTPYAIAKELGIKAVEAKKAIAQWQTMLQQDNEAKDVARDYLNRLVAHFDKLIEKSYENLDNLRLLSFDAQISAQINTTLKNLSEYEAKRVDLLQKAGLLDASDLGDELAERERREAILIDILRNHLCDDCKQEVAVQLGKVTGQVEIIQEDV